MFIKDLRTIRPQHQSGTRWSRSWMASPSPSSLVTARNGISGREWQCALTVPHLGVWHRKRESWKVAWATQWYYLSHTEKGTFHGPLSKLNMSINFTWITLLFFAFIFLLNILRSFSHKSTVPPVFPNLQTGFYPHPPNKIFCKPWETL